MARASPMPCAIASSIPSPRASPGARASASPWWRSWWPITAGSSSSPASRGARSFASSCRRPRRRSSHERSHPSGRRRRSGDPRRPGSGAAPAGLAGAAHRGAFDYLAKPFDLKELIGLVQGALSRAEPAEPGDPAALAETLPLIGRSPAMQNIYRVMARLMATDLTVMIFGESGTGKELAARALHDYGKRRRGPFVAVNMAAIPRELIESELFGHEKGAFTGAVTRGVGRFEQAAAGTLFLDEIGDMPLDAQTPLLRVLQQGEFTTVGGRIPIKADVRIIAATQRGLRPT